MKEDKKTIHRGQVLEKIVQNSDLSKTLIAKRAGYNRATLYNHFKTPDLSFGILEKYGKALGYDFTNVFPEMVKYIAFDDSNSSYPDTLSFEQVLKQRDQWKDRYYTLLEKYNKLIEDKLDLKT